MANRLRELADFHHGEKDHESDQNKVYDAIATKERKAHCAHDGPTKNRATDDRREHEGGKTRSTSSSPGGETVRGRGRTLSNRQHRTDAEEDAMRIPSRIREIRLARGLKQAQVAKRLGVSVPAIKNYENGRNLPRTENLIGLATALECTVAALTAPPGTSIPKPRKRRPKLSIALIFASLFANGPATTDDSHVCQQRQPAGIMVLWTRSPWAVQRVLS